MNSFIIGRSPKARVVLSSRTVSSEHLEVTLFPARNVIGGFSEEVELRDLDSTNGSFIYRDGTPVRFTSTLATYDDVLLLGSERCSVAQLVQEANLRQPAKPGKPSTPDKKKRTSVSLYIRKSDGSFKSGDCK